jgi:hypothetical protein
MYLPHEHAAARKIQMANPTSECRKEIANPNVEMGLIRYI